MNSFRLIIADAKLHQSRFRSSFPLHEQQSLREYENHLPTTLLSHTHRRRTNIKHTKQLQIDSIFMSSKFNWTELISVICMSIACERWAKNYCVCTTERTTRHRETRTRRRRRKRSSYTNRRSPWRLINGTFGIDRLAECECVKCTYESCARARMVYWFIPISLDLLLFFASIDDNCSHSVRVEIEFKLNI